MPPRQILVVEDEPSIADAITYALRTEAFDPVWVTTGQEALARFAREKFLLVILDVGLPDTSGFEVCRQLRATGRVPIIFVTARKDEIDRVAGLEMGGDDYVVKPFSPRELTARVRAILRRVETESPAPAAPSPAPVLALDEERCEIRCHGTALPLSRYEYRLLRVLMQRPGHVLSREQLMDQAWDEPESAFDRTVDAHIKTLRAKLRAAGAEEDLIRTHRGMGYSLKETGL